MRFISFLSDFGARDEWVAACKGVIYRITPDCTIIDISHEIPPFDIRKGALVLASAVAFCPVGVHMAVVDPGVGGPRRPLAIKAARGDVLIGPDNGLLIPAAGRLGGITSAYEITNRHHMRAPISPTFHGRDIFAPVAAHLSSGADIASIGRALEPALLGEMPWPKPVIAQGEIICSVIDIDRFGSLRLNVDEAAVQSLHLPTDHALPVEIAGRTYTIPFVTTFQNVPEGALLTFVDSSGWLSIAENHGNAAERLGVECGAAVTIRTDSLPSISGI